MPNISKGLRNCLILFVFLTLLVHLLPDVSLNIEDKVNISHEELETVLHTIDIIISTIIAVYTLIDQKLAQQRCIYDFSVLESSLSLQKYRRYSHEKENTFTYDCYNKNENIDTPYYGMEVILEDNPVCSVGISLCMEVFTELDGKCIEFSNLKICAIRQGKVEKKGSLYKGTVIKKPIQKEKKFLVRVVLLCNSQLEKILLNSCIYLNFILVLTDDRERKYKKYLFLKVQNIMGESRILSISSKNNWFSYIGERIKQCIKVKVYKLTQE